MAERTRSRRQVSPIRKPWHIDYLVMRRLTHDIAARHSYLQGRLLDVGCGQRPYARWLPDVEQYVGVDVDHESADVNAAALATLLPFGPDLFDSVLSTQTLEHVENPVGVLAEIGRVLRPGGCLVLTAPQSWRLHEKPYDFYRFTRYGLAYLAQAAGLEVLEIVAQGGVWATIGQIINNALHARFRHMVPVYGMYVLYLAINLVCGTLDSLWYDDEETLNYIVVARKPV